MYFSPISCRYCCFCSRAGKKGYSWTFLTPEQDWYSGDVIRALELSESLVPQVGHTVQYSTCNRVTYSWTFLTPEQDWYSGDDIRALELSESLVPQVGHIVYMLKRP
jgi:hypothetical protein